MLIGGVKCDSIRVHAELSIMVRFLGVINSSNISKINWARLLLPSSIVVLLTLSELDKRNYVVYNTIVYKEYRYLVANTTVVCSTALLYHIVMLWLMWSAIICYYFFSIKFYEVQHFVLLLQLLRVKILWT